MVARTVQVRRAVGLGITLTIATHSSQLHFVLMRGKSYAISKPARKFPKKPATKPKVAVGLNMSGPSLWALPTWPRPWYRRFCSKLPAWKEKGK